MSGLRAELSTYVTILPVAAPLAQSVECFHGKEKVTGSIPVGGSETTTSASAKGFRMVMSVEFKNVVSYVQNY